MIEPLASLYPTLGSGYVEFCNTIGKQFTNFKIAADLAVLTAKTENNLRNGLVHPK